MSPIPDGLVPVPGECPESRRNDGGHAFGYCEGGVTDDLNERFTGHQPRECGEHRAYPRRAYCLECSEWCYPDPEMGCKGCRLARLEHRETGVAGAIVRRLAALDDPRDQEYGDCLLCYESSSRPHAQSCPWRQAREWVASATEESGGADAREPEAGGRDLAVTIAAEMGVPPDEPMDPEDSARFRAEYQRRLITQNVYTREQADQVKKKYLETGILEWPET